ncbi:O-antigen ligase domain-containing protein [Mycobacterium sp. ST-F2]|uniref:O-antigen ligase domain-containing protein n=1 Tax=Mycobacterium sp. ST-F2 TaxID=1490484 RepID=UPI00114DCA3A|nr:O-antigen ligase domain-containing protein [Mycobacterium sp. ST-F2]
MTGIVRQPRVGAWATVLLFILLAALCGGLVAADVPMGKVVGIGLAGMVVGTAVTVLHPNAVYYAFAFVLGAIPFAVVPGLGQPMVFILAVAIWAALLTHPIAEYRTNAVEVATVFLVVTSLLSMVMTATGLADYLEFVKWLLGVSVLFVLFRLDRRVLRKFGQSFAIGTFVGAAFALGVFFFDKAGTTLNLLSPIGYGQTGVIGTHLRFYVIDNSTVVRLTGTYIDPNAAGIFLLIGGAFAVALLRGWVRFIAVPVIFGALIITLSRSAIFSAVVALLFFLLFQKMSTTIRLSIIGLAIVSAAGALSVPAIYSRFFDSFGSQDIGANDRAEALINFPKVMSGNWLFGKGWGVPEFTDEVVGYKTNYVANSPLLTVYRGGIFTGLAFVAVLIAAIVIAHRNARQDPWESGIMGAAVFGFAVVGLQLDFPVVTHAPMTMAFCVFLTLASLNPVEPDDPPRDVDDVGDGDGENTERRPTTTKVSSDV